MVGILPIVTIERIDDVLPLADALRDGGLDTLEVTLRTPLGLPAIERLRRERAELTIGAGTVWTRDAFNAALEHGAQFVVSPGTTDDLFECAEGAPVPWLPGGQTVTELARIYQAGYPRAKFFPAEAMGGTAAAVAIGDVLPALELCATGGINADNAQRYLALPNVGSVAGSWIAPAALIAARDWSTIAERARATRAYMS